MLLETIHAGGFSPTREYAGTSGPMWDQTFHAARVRMTVGGRVAVQLAVRWHCPDLLSWAYLDTREATHHVQIIEYILGFSVLEGRREPAYNGEPSLRQSRRVHRGSPGRRGRLDFVYVEVGRNAADNGL
ncbi:hypothetical protein EVAR_42931_1 [Eumeta japonica]|uniref:Uncharacterized protein n=1 Tax=Eumeta variegata TaxID=151549 RepID=A0A4C1WTV2_EUMVA|nr:hypothetical protein EVAR_42931_1 [Eumeta japonica]